MWNGKVTEELQELAKQYAAENEGMGPDSYDEVCYEAMSYDEFVDLIKESLRRHCCIVDVVWEGY